MRTPLKNRVVLGVVLAALVFAATHNIRAELPQAIGTWASLGATPESRVGAAAVVLKDGRTIIAGGSVDNTPTDSVVVFDPNTGSFSLAGQLLLARVGHTATLLDDGRVLIAGGISGDLISADLELFDPVTGVSVLGGAMTQPRTEHAAAKLADGKVLIVGGKNSVDGVLRNAEVWDPETGTATPTVLPMLSPRSGASATTLIDGRVLVAGGNNGTDDLKSAEIFEPSSQIFEATTTTLSFERSGHAAVLLPNNNSVLIAGGSKNGVPVRTSDLFVPAEFPDPYSYGMGAFAQTGDLLTARAHAVASPHIEGYAVTMGGGAPEAEVYRFPTIRTDKDDYAPGTKAIITGSGWEADKDVTLVFQEDPAVHDDYILHVPADANGNLSWNQWAPEEHDLNVRFYLMAKQTTSSGERRAQTTFTDSRTINGVTLNGASSVTVQSAASITAAVTVTTTGSGNNTQWQSTGWLISTTDPSGPPGSSGNPGVCVDTPDHNTNVTFTESFPITAPASSGTYNAYFAAYSTAGCNNGTGANSPSNIFKLTSGVVVDATAPTVTINQASGQADPTNSSPINFTVVFSESVSDFVTGDVTLSGTAGATTAIVTGSGTTYNVAVSGMTSNGTVIGTLPAGVAHDAVGNANTASTSTDNTVTYDTTPPTVTINQAGGQADPTNTSPINFTVVFSEPVTDFATGDVTLSGTAGATTATVTGSGTTYNVAVSGMGSDGTVIASIAAGVAHDAAGNANTASTTTDNTVTYDGSAPTVTINQASGQADPTNTSPINFTVVFSEPVSDFATGDVTLSGTAGATTATVTGSGTTYNVAVSGMTTNGSVIGSISAGVAHDAAGNANTASTSTDNTVTYDTTPPTVTINQASGQADPTNASSINFTVVFSESVNDFATGDVTLSGTAGATTATVTGSGTTYNVAVTGMTNDGTVIASIGAGVAHDAAGNANTASTSTDNTVTYDGTAPTVTINQASGQADPANTSPINFTVVFSESVTDFATGDVTLSGTAGATMATVTGSGTTFNIAVSGMTGDGTVIASINAGVAHDAAGNGNTASTSTDNTVTYDTTAPTVTINQASGQADPTNGSPINFTVVFSEPVNDFATGDVTLSGTAGATTAAVTGSGTTYNVAVSGMTSDGTVIASIAAAVAHDAAGNANTASTSTDNTATYDTTAPTVTINQASGQADPTNGSPINFTVVFSEPVNDFATGDVTLSGTANATVATVTGSGTTYNVAVSGMTSDGTVIASIAASAAHDAAGNGNTVSTSTDNTVTYDGTPPTVTINQASGQADPTNISPINFTVVFSEPVSDFATGDVTLSGTAGATTATVTGSGTTYNVAVSGMSSDGTVIANLAAGVAHDAAGNANTASTSTDNTVTFDTTPPTVTINQASGQADPTNASPINFTVVFSEPVNDFATGDVTLSGTAGATTAAVTGSGTTYNVAVSGMTADGTIIASIGGGVAHDAAGNANTASTSTDNTVTYDTTAPMVTINQASGQADPTNASPINFTVVFSEPVSDFATGDVTLSGTAGATTATVTGSGTTYNVAVSGMGSDGTVIASIATDAAHDAAGNGNAVSTSTDNTVTYDATPPTVTINQASGQADPTNASPINFTVVFSEPVNDFATGDVTLSGTAGATTATVTGSGTTYNVAVSGMTSDGTVIASIAAGVAHDAAGNANTASTSIDTTVTYDTTAPTVTINQASGQADPTNGSPINFTVVFSEPVSDFATGDVALSGTAGATTATVTGSGTTYNVAVTGMSTDGTVIATLTAGVAHDAAGNANTASTSTDNTVTYDGTAPTVTINQASGQGDPTNASPINFTVIFSEPVSDFATGDVTLSGTAGATVATVTGSGTTYNVAVSGMTTDGTIIASIGAGVAHDGAGNDNAASTSTDNTVTYDTTAPTVTINQASGQADPTNSSPIHFTVVFSEAVSDFATGDVTLSGTAGATTATVTGGGTTYNVAVSGMTSDGTVIASIAAGVAHDAAGNVNAASTSTDSTVTYDTTAPTVTINQASGQGDPTNGSPINFTVVFSEPVNDFATGDVTLSGTAGATTATVTGSGTTYNVAVTGMSTDGTVIATLTAGVAHDAAGNANTASTSTDNTVTYDGTAPTVTINQASGQADPTNASPINFTVIFSEPVSDFATGDVTLSGTAGATVATVTGSGTTYNVAVGGMTTAGTVIASVGAGVAHDGVGNGNAASTSTDNTVTYTPVVYDLLGLFEPYADPSHRSFKAGSTIPLKWQYTRDGSLFDSGSATPVVNVYGPVACGTVTAGDTVAVNDAGSSGLRYDLASKTWQYNWKTANSLRDCYYIQISNSTLGVTETFPIKIVK